MFRLILAGAFYRWGLFGVVCALLLMAVLFWWGLAMVWWLIAGVFFVFGWLSGLGYVLLLIFLISWLRGRRRGEHLLEYGRRRRWPE